jgi:hypothetical protein
VASVPPVADTVPAVVAEQGSDAADRPAIQDARDHEPRVGLGIDVFV